MIRTRFAPSPTGYMHIGNLRTALYAFLIARKEHGTLILRIEDTDQARNVPEAVAAIYKGLKLAGIEYDEGPDKEGDYGPYVQSERLSLYKQYAEKLVKKGDAYYCFCKKEDKVEEDDDLPKFINRRDPCRLITSEDADRRAVAGEEHVIRQRIPEEGSSTFPDHVYGEITISHDSLDDQVLLKSDGYPTYNFANVVDDHLMAVTHVVRGQEYLSSTPKYNLLYEAFGWNKPEYIHLPHIIKDSGEKFSKRNGDPSFEDLVNLGYLPEAIVNYVALLGWSPGNDQEFFTMPSLIEAFNMDRINKSSAAFSFDKLLWLNGEHIRTLSEEEFHKLALPYYPDSIRHLDLNSISQLIHIRVERLADITQMVEFLGEIPDYEIDLFENQKSRSSLTSSLQVLQGVLPVLESVTNWDNETLFSVLKQYGNENGLKVGSVMWPIRSSLSGRPNTPGGATELAAVLGKDESLKRIRSGLMKLETA